MLQLEEYLGSEVYIDNCDNPLVATAIHLAISFSSVRVLFFRNSSRISFTILSLLILGNRFAQNKMLRYNESVLERVMLFNL